MMTRVGQITITVPVSVDDLNMLILTRDPDGVETIITKAAKRALECLFLGVEFDSYDPALVIDVDLTPLNCPCGGCVGVQTCSED